MTWLARLLGREAPALTAEQVARLAAWRALPEPDMRAPIEASRYVVVDVESSGLNIHKDRLIAIGAVAVVNGRIALNDGLDIVLQQSAVSGKDNILIHGIGGTAQREGVPPADAMLTFLEYLGKDSLVAFHAGFDEAMIKRAAKTHLGLRFEHLWTDLAHISPSLYPRLALQNRSLDHWMNQFGIGNYARHSALADALATAELMLALVPRMRAQSVNSMRDMRALDQAHRRNNMAV
ncbi:MAG: PolC-type DNA polymerase III [Pseudomonadota bacterium]